MKVCARDDDDVPFLPPTLSIEQVMFAARYSSQGGERPLRQNGVRRGARRWSTGEPRHLVVRADNNFYDNYTMLRPCRRSLKPDASHGASRIMYHLVHRGGRKEGRRAKHGRLPGGWTWTPAVAAAAIQRLAVVYRKSERANAPVTRRRRDGGTCCAPCSPASSMR